MDIVVRLDYTLTPIPANSLPREPLKLPTRKILPEGPFSTVYPPGSTIVIEDDDIVDEYRGHYVTTQVTFMRRAGAGLSADIPQLHSLTGGRSFRSHATASQSIPSSQSTQLSQASVAV